MEGGTTYIQNFRFAAVLIFALLVLYMKNREDSGNVHAAGNDKDVINAASESFERRFHFYFFLNLGALALYLFCSFLPIISRIGYYLTISHILFLPMLLSQVSNQKQRKFFRAGIILAALLYFAVYMSRAGDDGVLILPYKTFFFHDMVNILSDVN